MYRGIKGVKDILPDDLPRWNVVERTAHRLARSYGFREIRIPVFEQTDLFVRSIGGTTDVVEKEMYTFPDKDGTSLTLRPEGTAGVVRAFIEHHMGTNIAFQKLFYLGPMFRHERPQAGRFRQFHQFGVEAVGNPHPLVDVEVISLLWNFFGTLHLPDLILEINSLGTLLDRQNFKQALVPFLKVHQDRLCQNCQRRQTSNPLRVLDCKMPQCREVIVAAPSLQDFLSASSSSHFQEVLNGLDRVTIPYTLNPRLVRGLDYYSQTTFEVTCSTLGAQNAIGAGGRYDTLFETLGGKPTPAIGFAVGLDRVLLSLPDHVLTPLDPLVFVAGFGPKGFQIGVSLLAELRSLGVPSETDYQATSLKNLLRTANRLGASLTVIIGDDEVERGEILLRNMNSKNQETMPLQSATKMLAERVLSSLG